MSFSVKEVFLTIQGEGANTGRPAVFCRFTGCNLWSGREADRSRSICQFCDTDFVGAGGMGGGHFHTADALAVHVRSYWKGASESPVFVVCTGGEPLLQLTTELVDAFHRRDCVVAIETNGTLPVPLGVDWVCVSPKSNTECVVTAGDELKVVFPQNDLDPRIFESWDFDNFFLQPMDGPRQHENIVAAIQYCKEHPLWRLSLQTHKLIGIP